MKKATLALAGFVIAGLAQGELSKYKNWGKSPDAYFLTASERAQWSRLQTDEEAEKFIADYWARRDPNPSTAQNEFRDLIQRRIAAADEQFKMRRLKGSESSQGRLFIMLGAPTRVQQSRGSEEGAVPPAGEGAAGSSAAGGGLLGEDAFVMTSTWTYNKDKFDPSWNVGELRARITVDTQRGVDQMVNSGAVNKVLETAAERSVVSAGASAATAAAGSVAPPAPGLPGTPPSAAVTPATAPTPAASSAAASAAAAPPVTASLPAAARGALEPLTKGKAEPAKGFFGGTFQTVSGDPFYALLLTLPGEKTPASGSVKFGGLVTREDGTEAASFWEDAPLKDVKTGNRTDKAFERSIVLPPGKYRGAFGLFPGEGETALFAAADAFSIAAPSSEFRVSPLILTSGGGLTPLTKRPNPTDPFVFGMEKPIRVEPKGNGLYTRDDALWYFYTVTNPVVPASPAGAPVAAVSPTPPAPGASAPAGAPTPAPTPAAAAKPRVMTRLGVMRDGKPAFQPATVTAELQPLGPGYYGSGSEIPLATFEPGYYILTLNLRDLSAPRDSEAFKGIDRQGEFIVLQPDGSMPPRPAAATKPTPRARPKKA